MNKHIVSVSVTQHGYEADEYGCLECEPHSILVSLIRVVRAATGFGLRESRHALEAVAGKGSQTGRKELSFLVDDAGLGRVYALKREQDARAHKNSQVLMNDGKALHSRWLVNKIEILELNSIGSEVIGGDI